MEIYIDILKAVADGKRRPTHIMYRANLSWNRMERYLDTLVNQDLLRVHENDGSVTYNLTTRGKDILKYHKKLKAQLYGIGRAIPTEVYARP